MITIGVGPGGRAGVLGGHLHRRGGGGAGIYRVARRADGTLKAPELAAEAVSPSYLAVHPGKGVVYAVREEDAGGVAAYEVAGARLREIGRRAAGALPCHLSVTPDGAHLVVADYGSGTVRAFPLAPDGGFAGDADVAEGHGSGPRGDRQEGPHAHDRARPGRDGADHRPRRRPRPLVPDRGRRPAARRGDAAAGRVRAAAPGRPPERARARAGRTGRDGARPAAAGRVGALEVAAESPATAEPAGDPAQGAAIKLGDGGGFVYTSMRARAR